MGLLSQKLRSGVIELVTDTGPVYASLTMLERAYLLWTFRNFPCLSRVVLNERQRELIDKLCRTPHLRHRIPGSVPIIGVVEGVTVAAQRKSVAAAAMVTMKPAEAQVAQAVGAGLQNALARVESRNPVLNMRMVNVKDRVTLPTTSTNSGTVKAKLAPWWSPGDRRRKWLRPAVALSAAAVVLAGFIYVQQNRAPSSIRLQLDQSYAALRTPGAAAAVEQAESRKGAEVISKPSAARVVGQPVTATVPLRLNAGARPATPTSISGSTTTAAALPSAKSGSPARVAVPLARVETAAQPAAIAAPPANDWPAAGATRETAATPPSVARMVVVASPVSFGYPVAPSATLIGKVHLRIVIGADGSVKDAYALSGNSALAEASVKAVRRWKYSPPLMNGQAVEAETNVTINFAGDDAVTIAYR